MNTSDGTQYYYKLGKGHHICRWNIGNALIDSVNRIKTAFKLCKLH